MHLVGGSGGRESLDDGRGLGWIQWGGQRET